MNRLCKRCGVLMTAILMTGILSGCGTKISDSAVPKAATIDVNQPIELISFDYSPGYSDMNGALHHESLHKNDNGDWIIESRDREIISEPVKITTYAVSLEDVIRFDTFLREKDFVSLENREESNDYWLDHSPWNYTIKLAVSDSEGEHGERHSIGQYQQFSEEDFVLMNEVDQLFLDIHGEKLSETIDNN